MGPSKNSDTPAAGHPRRLAPPTMLTWQSHASRSRAARGIHGCTTSGAPTILGRTPYAARRTSGRRDGVKIAATAVASSGTTTAVAARFAHGTTNPGAPVVARRV